MRVLAFSAFVMAASSGCAAPLDPERSALFLDFARTVSGNDPTVIGPAEQFVQSPPTSIEDIGFYGLEGASGAERALRGIISDLSDESYLFDMEIQYLLMEFTMTLQDSGVLGVEPFSPDLIDSIPDGDWGDPEFERSAMIALAQAMGPFARGIEAKVNEQGWEMLQLNVPFGDSVFYWFATPDEAAKWRCVTLWAGADSIREGRTVSFTITSVDWVEFYDLIRIEPSGGGVVEAGVLNVPVSQCAAPQV